MDKNNIPDIASFRHSIDIQIRFTDIDILGHVNNTIYLSMLDTGKAHYFREVRGKDFRWDVVETVIGNVDCAFIEQIKFGEPVKVLTRCRSIHHKSMILEQLIINPETRHIKAACETVMVGFDVKKQTSIPIPDIWRTLFAQYEGHELTEPLR